MLTRKCYQDIIIISTNNVAVNGWDNVLITYILPLLRIATDNMEGEICILLGLS